MSNTADTDVHMVKVALKRRHLQRTVWRVADVVAITAACFLTNSIVLAVVSAVGLVGEIALERRQKRQEAP